ncbi:MAG: hypothetical protein L0312_02020 [Acidobacteria bacterium]|nr:hypothetical protein [Acidobacteriota bacterium]
MSKNRIIGLNGQPISAPPPEPRNLPEMIEEARSFYENAEKRKAFHRLCDAMLMLSDGVARNMRDAAMLLNELRKINERITPK